jgi:glycogen(starch) synthase
VKIYWYAPFNNADEREVAVALGDSGDDVTLQTLATRRGVPAAPGIHPMRVVADLPDTPGDDGGDRTWRRRTGTTIARVRRRHHLLRSEEFDIVHVHTYNPFVDPIALRMLRQRNRLVLSIHNVLPHDRKLPNDTLERWLLRSGYGVPRRLVVAHSDLGEQLVDRFGVDASSISVIPLPIRSVDSPPPPAADRSAYLLFGTLRRNKGIEVALEAMGHIRDPDIRLHIAGQGDAALEQAVTLAAAADHRITAEIGYVTPERQDELLRRSATLLLPYTDLAAQSGVLRDACAYRRPVIATDVGALGAEVAAAGVGAVVAPRDAEQLADAMVALAGDEERWLQYHRAADQLARARSIPAIASMLQELYATNRAR